MKRWFSIPSSNVVLRGDFERIDLILNGTRQHEFLNEFSERVVDIYLAPLYCLITSGLLSESDIKRVTRRLFNKSGAVTDDFIRFAGEVIAA